MRPLLGWLACAVLAAGCVDLSRPRAYQCTTTSDCVAPWVCLKDQACHAPDVGAAVPCDTVADCTGGWFCGQEGTCRDPAVPGPFRCDDDTQCAGGWFCGAEHLCRDPAVPGPFPCGRDGDCAGAWRCSTEGRCVDLSGAPAALPAPTSSWAPRLVSPQTPPAELLRASPSRTFAAAGGPVLVQQAATVRGREVELTYLLSAGDAAQEAFAVVRRVVELSDAPVDLAVSGPALLPASGGGVEFETHLLARFADGGLALAGGGPERALPNPFAPGGAVTRLTPLSWAIEGEPLEAFGVFGAGGLATVLWFDGGASPVSLADVSDVAVGDPTKSRENPELLVLAVAPNAMGRRAMTLSSTGTDGGPGVELLRLPDVTGDQRGELRVESGAVAAAFGPSGGALEGGWVLLDAGSPADEQGAYCPPPAALVDFSYARRAGGPTLELACRSTTDGTTFVYGPGATPVLLTDRPAALQHGTSRGHARVMLGGQLRLGLSLTQDVADLLDTRPDLFGVHEGRLIAFVGNTLYAEALPGSGEARRGLEPEFAARDGGVPWVGLVEHTDWLVHRQGFVLDVDAGTIPYFVSGLPGLARPTSRPLGNGLVLVEGDTLFAAERGDGGTGVLRPVLKPSPGFPLSSWAARPGDGGFAEGWAVANNRLFQLTASSVDRWKATELPVTGRDPLAVWYSGAAARAVMVSGEVLSLPGRVPLAPALGERLDAVAAACDGLYAVADGQLSQLLAGGRWEALDAGRLLFEPELRATSDRVFLLDALGTVLELPVTCAP